jgi:hypothetical protein
MKQAHKGWIEGHPGWINILDRRTLDSCSACRMLSRHSRNPGCSSIYMANRCELAYWRFGICIGARDRQLHNEVQAMQRKFRSAREVEANHRISIAKQRADCNLSRCPSTRTFPRHKTQMQDAPVSTEAQHAFGCLHQGPS